MSDNTIKIPESLQFFFIESANQEAIKKLINPKDPPEDFNWNDLDAFYQAKLSAEKTQYDFWRFMLNIWEDTWGIINLPAFTEHSPQEYNKENRIGNVWDEDYVCKYFYIEKPNFYELGLGCYLNNTNMQLYFYLTYVNEQQYSPSDDMKLSSCWKTEDYENIRYSVLDSTNYLTNEDYDLLFLKKSANDAIYEIKKFLSI